MQSPGDPQEHDSPNDDLPSTDAPRRLMVATATYEERESIAEWIERVQRANIATHIVILDDDSPDGTADIVRESARTDPRIHLISRVGERGVGSAHRDLLRHARNEAVDVLVTLDADLSHSPEEIPSLLAALEKADFVIGSRFAPGGSSDYTGFRRLLSTSANQVAKRLLGTGIHEHTTSFRAMRRSTVETLCDHAPQSCGYAYFLEQTVIALRAGLRVSEVPIHFRDREHGASKIPRGEILRASGTLLRLCVLRGAPS